MSLNRTLDHEASVGFFAVVQLEALPYVQEISLRDEKIEDWEAHPFDIPSIRELGVMSFAPNITFLVGENGMGKSTILEAIAIATGSNPEGGSANFNFSTRASHSPLYQALRVARSYKRPRTGFFLRAESFFNLATKIEELDAEPSKAPPIIDSYGGVSLHEQSHGESFLSLFLNRFGGDGLYLLDEPEAALSPARQFVFLRRMHELINANCQFIIATHSPILLAYPGAKIYELSESGCCPIAYEESDQYSVTKAFLDNPKEYMQEILKD